MASLKIQAGKNSLHTFLKRSGMKKFIISTLRKTIETIRSLPFKYDIFFDLEFPFEREFFIGETIQIYGWCFHKHKKIKKLTLTTPITHSHRLYLFANLLINQKRPALAYEL